MHLPDEHLSPVLQSVSASQNWPSSHLSSHIPPQSVSVSCASGRPFLHGSSSLQVLATQFPERQFASLLHDLPLSHFSQLPPQSTSVSAPFFMSSSQAGWLQILFLQYPLRQSLSSWQERFRFHSYPPPPQSIPVSVPSLILFQHAPCAGGSAEKSVRNPEL